MKKFFSVILAILLIFSASSAFITFADEKEQVYPTIIVAGYSSSALFYDTPEGNQELVWTISADEILSQVLNNIAKLMRGIGELTLGNEKYISDTVGKAMLEILSDLTCKPDGTGIKELHTYSSDAEKTSFAYLRENLDGQYCYEPEIMATVAEIYEQNGEENGYEHIFSFQTDFRQNVIDCAADLDRYIDSVLAYTGAEKVNLYAVSHGGQITATYLAMYGTEKQAVNNAVLTVSAIGGAALAYDVISENIVFDEETLLYFVENGMMFETDFDLLVRANQFGWLDSLLNTLVHDWIKQILGYWGSIWDLIPTEYYEELKTEYLDENTSAALIEKSDYFHYNVLADMGESLRSCENSGINVYIVSGSDNPCVTGLQETSDGIIPVSSSTGAKAAPYSMRFSDGYITKNTVCDDAAHNHLSPAMNIDMSCGYLPEQTWLISGLFHGMTWKDSYSKALCSMLLFSEEKVSVYSYKEYPQFHYSTNVCYSVSAAFDSSVEGSLSEADTALVVTNLSEKYTMKLLTVSCEGADIVFDSGFKYIKPGESTTFSFSGSLPQKSLVTADITLTYKLIGSLTPYGSRTLIFTVNNGEKADFSGEFTEAAHTTLFEEQLSGTMKNILEKTGLFDLIKMFFNSLTILLKSINCVR